MTNGRFGALEQELGELKEALTSLERENMTLKRALLLFLKEISFECK